MPNLIDIFIIIEIFKSDWCKVFREFLLIWFIKVIRAKLEYLGFWHFPEAISLHSSLTQNVCYKRIIFKAVLTNSMFIPFWFVHKSVLYSKDCLILKTCTLPSLGIMHTPKSPHELSHEHCSLLAGKYQEAELRKSPPAVSLALEKVRWVERA